MDIHSPKYKELGHSKLLFCRGKLRNVQRFKDHMTAIQVVHLSENITVALAIVVYLSSLILKSGKPTNSGV